VGFGGSLVPKVREHRLEDRTRLLRKHGFAPSRRRKIGPEHFPAFWDFPNILNLSLESTLPPSIKLGALACG
jgi:hypothetical protein